MAGHLRDCPGGCGKQLLQGSDRACVDCEQRLPGAIRVRLATSQRQFDSTQYMDAVAAALAWFHDNPREVVGHA